MLFCLISGDYILRFGTAPARDFASSSRKEDSACSRSNPDICSVLDFAFALGARPALFLRHRLPERFLFIQGKLSPILHHRRDFRYLHRLRRLLCRFFGNLHRAFSRRSVIAFSRHIKPGTPDRAQNSLILRNYQDFFPITSISLLKVSSSPDQ